MHYIILQLDTLQEFARSDNKQELIDLLKKRTWYWTISKDNPKVSVTDTGEYLVTLTRELKYYDTIVESDGFFMTISEDFINYPIVPKYLLEICEVGS
jgi:hypothetical protein